MRLRKTKEGRKDLSPQTSEPYTSRGFVDRLSRIKYIVSAPRGFHLRRWLEARVLRACSAVHRPIRPEKQSDDEGYILSPMNDTIQVDTPVVLHDRLSAH